MPDNTTPEIDIEDLKIDATQRTAVLPGLGVVASVIVGTLSLASGNTTGAALSVIGGIGSIFWAARQTEQIFEELEEGNPLTVTQCLRPEQRVAFVKTLPREQAIAVAKRLPLGQQNIIRRHLQTSSQNAQTTPEPAPNQFTATPNQFTESEPVQPQTSAGDGGGTGVEPAEPSPAVCAGELPGVADGSAPVVFRGLWQALNAESGNERGDSVSAPAVDPLVARYGRILADVTNMDGAGSKPRHLAFLSISQCGKTYTIGALSYALRERYPDTTFIAVDEKNSLWPEFYHHVCFPGFGLSFDAAKVIRTIETVYSELERRVTGELKGDRLPCRIMLVLDEWNCTRADIAVKVDKSMLSRVDQMVQAIILQGLEFGIHLTMILQVPNCEHIGLSDMARLNLHFLALGRAGEQSMIDALLESKMILKSTPRANDLRRDFGRVWNDPRRLPHTPVALCSRTYTAEALPDFGWMSLINHGSVTATPPTPPAPPAPPEPPPSPEPEGVTDDQIRELCRSYSQNVVHDLLGVRKGSSPESERIRRIWREEHPESGSTPTFLGI